MRIEGIEMTVPVLGNSSVGGEVRALPPILVRPLASDWFDTRTKYDPDAVEELVPAPVSEEIRGRVVGAAVTAHRVFRCDGLTRSDFIVPEDGVPRFLEINTLPGLTPASLCPKAAAAAGMSFGHLVAELVELAVQKRGIDSK
jgi:D-alanine-D-alanine ligase